MQIRFFAGAADAVGAEGVEVAEQSLDLGALIALLSKGDEAVKSVLNRCSVLVDGATVAGSDAVIAGMRVDFLPPFAGG